MPEAPPPLVPPVDLSTLLVENESALRAMIASLVPNAADAEEVFQEACVVLWREWENYDPSSPFLPWARAICFNQVRSLRHRLRRYPQVVDPDLLGEIALPCEEATSRDCCDALDSVLANLPEPQRRLLHRFYVEEESAKQIGEATGKTATSVYKRVGRLRAKLLARLLRKNEEE